MTSTSIGYLVTGVIICTALVTCSGRTKLSDKAVRSVATTCEAAGQVVYVHMLPGEIKVECRQPSQVSTKP